MAMYITNAISLNMVADIPAGSFEWIWVPVQEIRNYFEAGKEIINALGHPDIASVVSSDLGFEVKSNRISTPMQKGDIILIAQYVGPRLPEGAKALPDGAKVKYAIVKVQ